MLKTKYKLLNDKDILQKGDQQETYNLIGYYYYNTVSGDMNPPPLREPEQKWISVPFNYLGKTIQSLKVKTNKNSDFLSLEIFRFRRPIIKRKVG